ncbi:MAG: DegT/DnrJ/EryC1/StrS aminotransferase family protein [Acidimicrobiales bacterium]|nr:DegT/DnrJ/EryC1/StrS aminotransferase family protein [Acidimicrobiales bacterium]
MSSADFVYFARPDTGEDERLAVEAVLASGWLTSGEECRRFEAEFADAVGAKHALALNSCTAAMHLALEAVGVAAGDLVITTPYTFAATAEVIRYLGATPVLVDVEPHTLNLDTELLADIVDRLTHGDASALPPALRSGPVGPVRGLMPVHIAGHPCEQQALGGIAETHGLAVVEDAAHAFPAAWHGRTIGSPLRDGVRHAACFSFYATKTVTTGEGGMLVTDDDALVERARVMSLHGISATARDRYTAGGSWEYDILAPGFKYNLTDLAAALGRVQLAKAVQMRDRRAEIASLYTDSFADVPGLETPTVLPDCDTAWHLYQLRISPAGGSDARAVRAEFVTRLQADGIGTSVHFIPLHLHTYYRDLYGYVPEDFPVAYGEFLREISLPIYSSMTDAKAARVVAAVRRIAADLL